MRITSTLAGLAAAVAVMAATPAFADSMTFASTDIGKTVTLNYNGFTGTPSSPTTYSGLTGSTTFTLTGVSGNDYTFDYSVSNTSSAPVTDSRISSFAFDTDPSIASATSTGAFSYTTLNANYPNGIGTVDVCFKDATTGSCAGGGSGGLTIGQSGTGSFTLSFSTAPSALTLSNFFVRYQSIGGISGVSSASGSGTISSTSTTTSTSTGGTPVPEPGMLGLFGAGLIGLAFARRRAPAQRRTLAAA